MNVRLWKLLRSTGASATLCWFWYRLYQTHGRSVDVVGVDAAMLDLKVNAHQRNLWDRFPPIRQLQIEAAQIG